MSLRDISVTPYKYVRRTFKDSFEKNLITVEDVKFLNGKIFLENEIKFLSPNISIVTDLLENPDVASPVLCVNSKF